MSLNIKTEIGTGMGLLAGAGVGNESMVASDTAFNRRETGGMATFKTEDGTVISAIIMGEKQVELVVDGYLEPRIIQEIQRRTALTEGERVVDVLKI